MIKDADVNIHWKFSVYKPFDMRNEKDYSDNYKKFLHNLVFVIIS